MNIKNYRNRSPFSRGCVIRFTVLFILFAANNIIFSQYNDKYHVINYSLNLNIYNCFLPPYSGEFNAEEVITFEASENINNLTLDAVNSSLKIDSIPQYTFTHTNDILTINLGRTFDIGDTFSIQIFYKHKNVRDSAFYSSPRLVYTDCEPQKARKWFVCDDRPSDKGESEIFARTPLNVKLGSNGSLEDSTVSGDTLIYHWKSSHPIATYLIAIAGSSKYNLDIFSTSDNQIPIRFYWFPWDNAEKVKDMEEKIIKINDYYSFQFGDYPFEKIGFAVADSSFPWGGMENQTMILLCPTCWTEDVVSHEFAHHWFGDMISPGTWADIWLNESFATYCEALWREHEGGYKSYKSTIDDFAIEYLFFNPGYPIYDPDWVKNIPDEDILFNPSTVYSKGACVLHMLRYMIGDDMFFKILNDYTSDTNLRFKYAVTQDFINKVNGVTGNDYNWFFDEWLMQPNHPIYKNNFEINDVGNDKWEVSAAINQVQKENFFRMPIELKVVFDDKTDTTFRVDNDKNGQKFIFQFKKEPQKVIFDPGRNIVLRELQNKE